MSTKFLQARQQDQEVRQALAKDLRKEHFNFGFENTMPKQSKYAESMKEHPLLEFGETKNEMEKLRKDLRKEHYSLGTDKDPKTLFQTSASNAFKKFENPEKSKLSQETKNDLRSCHFVLGYDMKGTHSDYKINFANKDIDAETFKDRKDQVQQLRSHHQVFNDKKDYNSSLYNETINKQYDPSYIHQGKSKNQIRDQIVELRKTNLLMGTNNPNYNSEANQEFSDKGYAKNSLKDIDLRSTNYQLGSDENQYKTTVGETFKGEFKPPDNGKTKELVSDLRKEHYQLGNDKAEYKSENTRTYKQFHKDELAEKPDLSGLYRSHFQLGGASTNVSTQQRYLSDYKQTFQQRDKIKNESLRNDRTDRQSNICFGSDKNKDQFSSEQASNLVDYSSQNQRGVLDVNLSKDLRGTHYEFGTDQNGYLSQNQETFQDKSKKVESSKLDAELKKDLRRNHFEYGTAKNDFDPMQKDIGKYQGPPSKLDPTLSKQLRSHHFNHGIYQVDYTTSYKKNHIDFSKE